ncbi:MAG: UDP-N-acetylmuramoyl-tripeptide--D-alanyl-D-alanine ligase [Candidatus Kapabacteria bacterium]|nr:UDP-N-acetylmuramoyl-tripeptide--D-alanyl-D-alanine ligase [Candidatus Kapabacteria bacterium]
MPTFAAVDLSIALSPCAVDNLHTFTCTSVSTDTRTLENGAVFIALQGERYDGHDFIPEAIARGASALVLDISRRGTVDTGSVPVFWVNSTLDALAHLARFHRRRFRIPIVAVAGSVGKTTTKDIAAHLLSSHFTVHKTPGNWNNAIGVPLTLLGIEEHHTIAVVELGTNHPGEIAHLCSIAEPTHGVITAIAEEHLEFLGSLDGVEEEETALFRWLTSVGGTACVNVDDERLRRYASVLPSVITFGTDHSAMLQAMIRFDRETLYPLLELQWQGQQVTACVHQPGGAAARCALAAAAVALSVGLSAEAIAHGLATYRPAAPHGYARMVVQKAAGGITILNDTYNANPASMRSAIETLAVYPARRRIAVLGDMRELGAAEHAAHCAIIQYAAERVDALIVIGAAMERAVETLKETIRIPVDIARGHSDAARIIRSWTATGDAVLIKSSRSLELERIIPLLGIDEQS